MGTVKETIGVGDTQGRRFEDVEVVVDTGSTYTPGPRELLRRLGVPVKRSLPSETADERILPVNVGETTIRLHFLKVREEIQIGIIDPRAYPNTGPGRRNGFQPGR